MESDAETFHVGGTNIEGHWEDGGGEASCVSCQFPQLIYNCVPIQAIETNTTPKISPVTPVIKKPSHQFRDKIKWKDRNAACALNVNSSATVSQQKKGRSLFWTRTPVFPFTSPSGASCSASFQNNQLTAAPAQQQRAAKEPNPPFNKFTSAVLGDLDKRESAAFSEFVFSSRVWWMEDADTGLLRGSCLYRSRRLRLMLSYLWGYK